MSTDITLRRDQLGAAGADRLLRALNGKPGDKRSWDADAKLAECR